MATPCERGAKGIEPETTSSSCIKTFPPTARDLTMPPMIKKVVLQYAAQEGGW
jgi:hypothetical protein